MTLKRCCNTCQHNMAVFCLLTGKKHQVNRETRCEKYVLNQQLVRETQAVINVIREIKEMAVKENKND